MSYDEVIEVFKVKRPDAKVTTLKKIPCAQDKIDANNSNIKAKKNCIRAVVFERAYGPGEGYMVVASFVEDLPNNSGTSIVTEVLYKQYYGKKKAKLRDFTNSVKEKYGVYRSDTTNTHFRSHGRGSGHSIKLPFIQCCSEIGYPYQVRIYSGTWFNNYMETAARRIVDEATRSNIKPNF